MWHTTLEGWVAFVPAQEIPTMLALLGCWVEKLLRAAFAWLRRFAVVVFRIVGDVCCRLAPEAPGDSRRVLARFSTISGRFPA